MEPARQFPMDLGREVTQNSDLSMREGEMYMITYVYGKRLSSSTVVPEGQVRVMIRLSWWRNGVA
jgi:hypothetical protein